GPSWAPRSRSSASRCPRSCSSSRHDPHLTGWGPVRTCAPALTRPPPLVPRKKVPVTVTAARRLLVLDDDPTGSQCVAGIPVAFDEDPEIPVAVLSEPGSACFVLTNTRALDEGAA